MTDVLLLNADYSPLRVVAWQKAVALLLQDKVGMVAEYAGRFVRSKSIQLPWPAVIVLRTYTRFRSRVPFNRMSVIARDGASCQYCGVIPRRPSGRLALEELTLDHVVPRAQSKNGRVVLPWTGRRVAVSCWENIVTSCEKCNRAKGARTPRQAGMPLRATPKRPDSSQVIRMRFARAKVPPEWKQFLPRPAYS